MKLSVAKLKDGENAFAFESAKDGWVKEVIHRVEKQGYKLKSPLNINVQLTKLEPDYYLKGKLKFKVEQSCARCAECFVLPVEHQFEVALAHVATTKVNGATLSDESEELDVNFFEGNEIDLSPLVEEQYFLSIPYQSLCKTECRGVCQQCGQNLNHKDCGCIEASTIKPFSVLQTLKL